MKESKFSDARRALGSTLFVLKQVEDRVPIVEGWGSVHL